jgi:hypothetical protein
MWKENKWWKENGEHYWYASKIKMKEEIRMHLMMSPLRHLRLPSMT